MSLIARHWAAPVLEMRRLRMVFGLRTNVAGVAAGQQGTRSLGYPNGSNVPIEVIHSVARWRAAH